MGHKMVPKILLEGTRLTHKTDLAFALNEHPRVVGQRRYRYHSPVISAEWGAFDNVPWGRGPIDFEPHQEAQALETYDTWVRMFELQRYSSWIVDRFHISTQLHQRLYAGREYDFSALEARLRALNFRLVFLERTPESFARAKAERLKISGNPSQYDDLDRFVKEQVVLQDLVAQSTLQTLRLDISDDDIPGAADRVADWMEATGGLYLD